MASKKSGKAAGLAALAGLAYMASQKGGKTAPDRDDADTYTGSRASKSEDATESGDFLSRRLKTNPESGAAYSMDNLSPMSSGKAAPATGGRATSPAKAPSAPAEDRFPPAGSPVLRSIGPTPSKAPGGVGKRGGVGDGGKSMIDRQDAAVARANRSMTPAGGKPMTVDQYYESGKAATDKEENMFKRGGAVKKMASGGLASSASKRGDGIASKGKTRCKMY